MDNVGSISISADTALAIAGSLVRNIGENTPYHPEALLPPPRPNDLASTADTMPFNPILHTLTDILSEDKSYPALSALHSALLSGVDHQVPEHSLLCGSCTFTSNLVAVLTARKIAEQRPDIFAAAWLDGSSADHGAVLKAVAGALPGFKARLDPRTPLLQLGLPWASTVSVAGIAALRAVLFDTCGDYAALLVLSGHRRVLKNKDRPSDTQPGEEPSCSNTEGNSRGIRETVDSASVLPQHIASRVAACDAALHGCGWVGLFQSMAREGDSPAVEHCVACLLEGTGDKDAVDSDNDFGADSFEDGFPGVRPLQNEANEEAEGHGEVIPGSTEEDATIFGVLSEAVARAIASSLQRLSVVKLVDVAARAAAVGALCADKDSCTHPESSSCCAPTPLLLEFAQKTMYARLRGLCSRHVLLLRAFFDCLVPSQSVAGNDKETTAVWARELVEVFFPNETLLRDTSWLRSCSSAVYSSLAVFCTSYFCPADCNTVRETAALLGLAPSKSTTTLDADLEAALRNIVDGTASSDAFDTLLGQRLTMQWNVSVRPSVALIVSNWEFFLKRKPRLVYSITNAAHRNTAAAEDDSTHLPTNLHIIGITSLEPSEALVLMEPRARSRFGSRGILVRSVFAVDSGGIRPAVSAIISSLAISPADLVDLSECPVELLTVIVAWNRYLFETAQRLVEGNANAATQTQQPLSSRLMYNFVKPFASGRLQPVMLFQLLRTALVAYLAGKRPREANAASVHGDTVFAESTVGPYGPVNLLPATTASNGGTVANLLESVLSCATKAAVTHCFQEHRAFESVLPFLSRPEIAIVAAACRLQMDDSAPISMSMLVETITRSSDHPPPYPSLVEAFQRLLQQSTLLVPVGNTSNTASVLCAVPWPPAKLLHWFANNVPTARAAFPSLVSI